MDAVSKGAFEAGGLTIGVLPDKDDSGISSYVTIPIITGMGNARNNINVLSSKVVIAPLKSRNHPPQVMMIFSDFQEFSIACRIPY